MATQLRKSGDQASGTTRRNESAGRRGIQVETDRTAIGDDEQPSVWTEKVLQHSRSVAGHVVNDTRDPRTAPAWRVS